MIRDIAITAFIYDFDIDEEFRQELKRWNSNQRAHLRRREKNRKAKPVKYDRQYGEPRKSDKWDLPKLLRGTAAALFHRIEAISTVERDRQGIYPDDFRHPRVPLWRMEKMWLLGLGLRDYSEPITLLTKFGTLERDWRQKAAAPGYYILVTRELAAFYLWLLSQLKTPEQQLHLEVCGRLYRNGCGWWPCKEERGLSIGAKPHPMRPNPTCSPSIRSGKQASPYLPQTRALLATLRAPFVLVA